MTSANDGLHARCWVLGKVALAWLCVCTFKGGRCDGIVYCHRDSKMCPVHLFTPHYLRYMTFIYVTKHERLCTLRGAGMGPGRSVDIGTSSHITLVSTTASVAPPTASSFASSTAKRWIPPSWVWCPCSFQTQIGIRSSDHNDRPSSRSSPYSESANPLSAHHFLTSVAPSEQ